MTRRLIGAIVSLLALLSGLWLVLAPFALGFQAKDHDWTDNTLTDVWTGIPLAIVGLVGVIVFTMALRTHMLQAGFITPRPAPSHQQTEQQGPAAATQQGGAAPAAARSSETDEMLRPLIAALARDIAREDAAPMSRTTETIHHREYGTSATNAETGTSSMPTLR